MRLKNSCFRGTLLLMELNKEFLQQALSLSAEQRTLMIEALEDSLNENAFASPEIAAAWAEEIERRAQAIDSGEVTTEDWQVVMARLRSKWNNA